MIKPKKRIAFVGVGGMGQAAHLANYMLLGDECEVVACADLDEAKAQMVALRNGISKTYRDFREMLEREELDGIVASQQFQIHHEIIPELLAYEKPLFIEKPLGASIAAGELLLEQIRNHRGRVFIGYHKRSDLATIYARSLVKAWRDSGDKGKLTHIRISMPPGDWMSGAWPHRRNVANQTKLPTCSIDDPDNENSESYKKQFIEFVNYYIHQVNLIRFLSGQDYVVRYVSSNERLLVAEMDDGASVTLEMATYHTSLDWQERAEVYFEQGWIALNLPAPMVQCQSGSVETFENDRRCQQEGRFNFAPEHAMLTQARNFLKFIDDEYSEATTPLDALKDLRVAQEFLALKRVEEKGAACR